MAWGIMAIENVPLRGRYMERKSTRAAKRGGRVKVYKVVDGKKVLVREESAVPKKYKDRDFDTNI